MELNANDKDSKQIITLTCINDNSKFNIQTDLNITFNDLYDKIKDNINITYNFSIDSSKDNIEIFTNSFGKIEPSSIVNELDLLVRFSDNLFYTIKEQYDKNINTDLEELASLEKKLSHIGDSLIMCSDQTKSIESWSIFKCCKN